MRRISSKLAETLVDVIYDRRYKFGDFSYEICDNCSHPVSVCHVSGPFRSSAEPDLSVIEFFCINAMDDCLSVGAEVKLRCRRLP